MVLLLLCTALPAQARPLGLLETARGLRKPVDMAFPAGSARSMYVVEQGGRILRLGNGRRRVVLDISTRVTGGWEEGLLSMAFRPGYREDRGKPVRSVLYVNYTTNRGGRRTIVSEIPIEHRYGHTRANLGRERVLLSIPQPYANHNGGHILFGPDRMLYVGMGDGGSGGDPRGYGQNPRTLLGKILRIDPRPDRQRRKPYRIPGDNPFVGQARFRPEIFALGLRNPWRMTFDRATGRLYAADVGQVRREEVNLVARGANLGWKIREGRLCYAPARGCRSRGLVGPIHDYGRQLGQSITGGHVYRGRRLIGYRGAYFFADYMSGRVWALPLTKAGGAAGPPRLIFARAGNISSFGQDQAGELYLAAHRKGRIYRIVRR